MSINDMSEKTIVRLEKELAEARRLLVDLRDLQNGPPLITEKVGWEKTMLAINVFLARTAESDDAHRKVQGDK